MKEQFIRMKRELTPSEEAVRELQSKLSAEKKPKPTYKKQIAIAACVALLCAAGLAARDGLFRPGKAEDNTSADALTEIGLTEIALEGGNAACYAPEWSTLKIYEKFDHFLLDGNEYDCVYNGTSVSPSAVGEKLFEQSITGFHAAKNETLTVNAEVFAFAGVSEDAYLAVKYEGDEGYYPFRNTGYTAGSLGEVFLQTGMLKNIAFSDIDIHSVENGMASMDKSYRLTEEQGFIDLLSSLSDAKGEQTENFDVIRTDIYAADEALGTDIHISVSENGYLIFNARALTGKEFFIGKENAERIREYILAHSEVAHDRNIPQTEPPASETAPPEATTGTVQTAPAYDPNGAPPVSESAGYVPTTGAPIETVEAVTSQGANIGG